jgi:hypothetical protein
MRNPFFDWFDVVSELSKTHDWKLESATAVLFHWKCVRCGSVQITENGQPPITHYADCKQLMMLRALI